MGGKEMNQQNSVTKQIAINMFFGIVAFVLNLGISFFITPYITGQFGTEAYGFVKMADDFRRKNTFLPLHLPMWCCQQS